MSDEKHVFADIITEDGLRLIERGEPTDRLLMRIRCDALCWYIGFQKEDMEELIAHLYSANTPRSCMFAEGIARGINGFAETMDTAE